MIGLVGAALVAGCGQTMHTTTLAWYRVPCQGPFARMCPVERSPGGQVEFVYDGMVGYQPAWGVEADVRYHVEPGPGDADSVDTWVIDEVVATREVAVGTAAVWRVIGPDMAFTAAGDHVELLGQPVACEPALCAQLVAIAPSPGALVDIAYTGDAAMPLRATGLRPAP